jgi:uncharacterized protein (TIGR02300 family)
MQAPVSPSRGAVVVAKPELGTKRICANCGAKFYDLTRVPIICPKCGTEYQPTTSRSAARPEPVVAAIVAEEPEIVQPAEAEVISLEEADAEAAGTKKAPVADAEIDTEDEVEVAAGDDETFLEQEEEEPGDVSDIIGEKVEDEDET